MKLAVLVATGFEDTELITTINVFARNAISFDLFSVENIELVKGQKQAIVKCKKFSSANWDDYDGLFIPGGKGHEIILENQQVIKMIQNYKNNNKWLLAICAGPRVLFKAQVVNDKKITCHPNYASEMKTTGQAISVDGKIITGRDFESTLDFAKTIIKEISK